MIRKKILCLPYPVFFFYRLLPLAGYSSECSDSDSDDGISVVIHKNPQPKKTSSHNDRSKPVRSKRPAPPASSTNKVKTKFQKTESVLGI